MRPPIAIAVVSWNTRDLLRACLDSLKPDVDGGLASVWVVDNGSRDGSPDLVEREFGWAHLLAPGANLGFGPAVNLVAEHTDAPWIAPSNADVEAEPGALGAMLAAGEGDPRVAAVAPRLVMPDGRTQHSVHPFPTLPLGLAFNLGLQRVVPGLGDRLCLEGYWNPARPRSVDWAHGAFLLVRRRAFDGVGGFDPGQWLYAEDLDLAWRLAAAGWTVRYEPVAVVRHAVGAAAAQAFADDRDAKHVAAAYAWIARRQGVAAARGYAALNVGGAIGRWLALAILSPLGPERLRPRRERLRRDASLHRAGLRRRPPSWT
ncbi:MAG TPA: glycosyltransferase family 2 protein [Solirubrobacterales bacterium]|nr:glycosyltransferase family 2 protein [Solirubrobacterales bacterium]